jgi:hypothetical protein
MVSINFGVATTSDDGDIDSSNISSIGVEDGPIKVPILLQLFK